MLLAGLCSCGSGTTTTITFSAQNYLAGAMVGVFGGVPRLEGLVPAVLVPAARAAAGITFELDTSPGAEPNTFAFTMPFDCDGDGTNDTTATGTAQLNLDPIGNLASGFSATANVTVTSGAKTFQGTLTLRFDSGGAFLVHGSGTVTDSDANTTVTIAVDEATPLHIRTADADAPDKQPNACAFSIDGPLDLTLTHASGEYAARWTFDPTSRLVGLTNGRFTPTGGAEETLPDATVDMSPNPPGGNLNRWAGTWTLAWFCAPSRSGTDTMTITVRDANTIDIVRTEPPPDGRTLAFTATRDAKDPDIVRGEYQALDDTGSYIEVFSLILSADGNGFRYEAELRFDFGGNANCGGTATRD